MSPIRHRFTRMLLHLPAAAIICLLMLFAGTALAAEPAVTVVVGQRDEAFIIDASMNVQATPATAWAVLTDFDHMASIIENLTSSKVTSREGNTWTVRQEGVVRWGIFAFSFESEREVRLEPMKRILVKGISGTLKRMHSESRIEALDQSVQIRYHAETVPDSFLARMFGGSFVRDEVAEQFQALAREMLKRQAASQPVLRQQPPATDGEDMQKN